MQIQNTAKSVMPASETPQRLASSWLIGLHDVLRSASSRIAIALTHRNFRLLWMGALTSSIGTWMQKVAQAWLIVSITGSRSAFFLGLDSFLGESPLLLLTMLGGVFADRRDRRHMILMSQIIQMLVALLLAVLVYRRRIHIAHVLALSLIAGCARAFGGPAYQSLIPTLVGKKHLPNAIALNSIQFNLAQVIGPFLAGAALAGFGMVACFGLNGVSFLFVITAILALRDVPAPRRATESVTAQFRSGLRFVRGSSNFMTVMGLGFFVAFLGTPLLTFLPVIVKDVFHQGVGFYTQLMTFSGAGAVMGALIIAWLGEHKHMGRILLILLTLFGTIIVGFGLSRRPYLSALILFTGGSLFVMCSSLTTSLAQLLAPPEFRGRVISIYLVAFLGGSPLGGLTSGWLVMRIGSMPVMLVVNGMVLTFVALYFLTHGQSLKGYLDGLGRKMKVRARAQEIENSASALRERTMTDMRDKLGAPKIVDRSTFHAELDALRVREKAHTHEGDAIAAARRRLPMVEVDGATQLTGERGMVTLLDAFEGRQQLLAYYFMWRTGHPAPEQCEGCTWVTTQVRELSSRMSAQSCGIASGRWERLLQGIST